MPLHTDKCDFCGKYMVNGKCPDRCAEKLEHKEYLEQTRLLRSIDKTLGEILKRNKPWWRFW